MPSEISPGKAGMSDKDLRVGGQFPGGPGVMICCFHCCSLGSFPAWGTKILKRHVITKTKTATTHTWDCSLINGHSGQ